MRLSGSPWLLVALLCAIFASSAKAAVTVDSVSTADDNNPTSLTVSHTTSGSERLMLVGVSFNNDDFEVVTSVTYGGNPLSFVGADAESDDSRVEIWALVAPPAVTADVVVTFDEQVQQGAGIGVITFNGVDQASPYGAFQSSTGSSTTASLAAASDITEVVFGVMAAERQDDPPSVVGGVEHWAYKTQPGNNRTVGAGATYAGAGTVNLTWNLVEWDQWAVGAVSLRPASVTTSPGYCDDFESGLGNWAIDTSGGGDAGINGDTFNSPGNSLFTRWNGVSVTSAAAFDASATPFGLSLWVRRGSDAFSEDPDGNENLEVQYFNDVGSWITLETFSGGDTPGEIFERSYALPADAQHAGLRVRFVQTSGSGSDWDYWHVDDVCVLPTAQPQIEWRMDETGWNGTAGEVVDSSGNGNDATANTASGLTTVDPGQICRAGDFDGVDDYIESSDIFALLRTTASLSFWIRTTQTGDNTGWRAPGIAGAELAGGTNDIFWGWLDASGRIGISVGDNYASKSTNPINDDTYHHVVLTRDAVSGAYKIYVDGVLDNSGTLPTGDIGTGFSSIGRIEDTGGTPEYFQGDLDEVLVFDSVLSDSEVGAIYTQQSNGRNLDGSERFCTGALAWFRLDAAAGTWNGTPGEVVDQSGNFKAAFALGTGAGVDSVPAQVCRGIDVPDNNSNGAQYGFDSGVDIDDDVGNTGTISFWYRGNADWNGGGIRTLFDASPDDLPGSDKYFLLALRNDGSLLFGLEDTSDGDYRVSTGGNAIGAGTWVHIAVTWDMNGDREIYLDGALAASDSSGTNGQIGALRTLYFGDNRSSYHPDGTPNSADGVIDEARIYARAQSQAEITADMNATHPCSAAALDHFVITPATTAASTCLPNAITIEAEDSSNNTIVDYTGTVAITTSTSNGNWSVNTAANVTNPNPDNDDNGAVGYTFLLADAGDIVLDLVNTHAETLTVTVTDASAAVSSASVAITFADNVFVITEDPVQVAGRPQAMSVAMWTNDGSDCFVDTNYDYPSVTLDANIDRGGVLPAAADPSIGATTIPDTPASNSITLDFSVTPGQAAFTLATTDVGQYRLSLVDNSSTHGDVAISGTSMLLTVRPFGLAVTAIEAPPGPVANPGSTLASEPVFTAAGADFRATVAGVLWAAADDTDNDGVLDAGVYANNAVAPSYAWDSLLSVSGAGFTPASGAPGGLNNGSIAAASFGGGSATASNLQYTEVGSFTLQSSATDYLGEPSADLVGDDIVVGRFIPASFDITIVDNGALDEACGVFSYMGQDFGYATAPRVTATARNALGAITTQYRDAFNKLNGTSLSVDTSRDDTTLGSDGNPLLVSYTTAAMAFSANPGSADYSFGADTFRYGPDAPVTFSKSDNSRVAPFVADINPEISQVSDGEVSTVFVSGTHVLDPAGNNLRFGRLRMENTHGSEVDPLIMPAFVDYWTGAGFARSLGDTCTAIADADLVSVASPPGLSTPSVINNPASAGDVDYNYPAPGAGNDGFVDTTTDLNSASHLWLRYDWDGDGVFDNDPQARATFGIYDGSPVQIYIQQVYE